MSAGAVAQDSAFIRGRVSSLLLAVFYFTIRTPAKSRGINYLDEINSSYDVNTTCQEEGPEI